MLSFSATKGSVLSLIIGAKMANIALIDDKDRNIVPRIMPIRTKEAHSLACILHQQQESPG